MYFQFLIVVVRCYGQALIMKKTLNQILAVSDKEILLEDNYLEIDDMFEFYLEETELNKIEKLH